jgi:hypothetical protein
MCLISFDSAPFVRSHMKQPKGRGSWAFSIEGGEPLFAPVMTLNEAKLWVTEQVRRLAPAGFKGVVVVQVLP